MPWCGLGGLLGPSCGRRTNMTNTYRSLLSMIKDPTVDSELLHSGRACLRQHQSHIRVCLQATLPNMEHFHGEHDSPADFCFPLSAEKPSRIPVGDQLSQKKVLCHSLSSYGPPHGCFQQNQLALPRNVVDLPVYLHYAPPIHGTFYGENNDQTLDEMRLFPL